MDNNQAVVYISAKLNQSWSTDVRRFFILVAFALSFMSMAPVAQANSIASDEDRRAVFVALAPIQISLRAEFDVARANFQAATDPQERALLGARQRLAGARVRFIASLRNSVRTRYTDRQLEIIIERYDLAVSLS